MNEAYWLTNVTLDSGFVFENGRIDRTKTAAYNMYIKKWGHNGIAIGFKYAFENG